MKTTMKLFAVIAIMFGISATCLSQTNGSISANAQVFGSAAITTERNLEFGNLALGGGTKSISVAGVATGNASIPGTTNQGTFKLTNSYSSNAIALALVVPATLSGSLGGTMPLTSPVAVWNTISTTGTGGGATAFVFTGNTGAGSIPAGNTSPTIYVHVGGTVNPDGGSTIAGIYSGTITLQATYN